MNRARAIAYAALTAVEVSYVLHENLPRLWPPPPCESECSLTASVLFQPAFPWPWIALTALLLLSAVAILLRKEAGIASGFVGQALLLAPFTRDMVYEVGSFLFTGSGYSGVDPSYRDLAFNFLALTVVIGPALALLLLMTMRPAASNRAPARIAAILLGAQLVILVLVAVIVFRATFQDCEHNGPGTPIIDGVPGCPDYADLDVGRVVATILPSAAVLLLVCVGVWRGRAWAISGGIVWQLLLAVSLAAMGVMLRTEPSQNAWYDHFPTWTSPGYLAYALMIIVPVPTLAALLAARASHVHGLAPSRGEIGRAGEL